MLIQSSGHLMEDCLQAELSCEVVTRGCRISVLNLGRVPSISSLEGDFPGDVAVLLTALPLAQKAEDLVELPSTFVSTFEAGVQ